MQTFRAAIKTTNGFFLTAVNGGGLGGPDAGPAVVALHTDATAAGKWETFRVVTNGNVSGIVSGNSFSLQTLSGNFVTAVNGGGIGGPNDGTSPVHSDATTQGGWETFTFNLDDTANPPTVQIQTSNGNYLTSVNGGGVGGPNTMPIHTDGTSVAGWESFVLAGVTASGAASTSTFTFSLDNFQILNTRSGNIFSTSSDTDYASLSVTVGDNPAQVKTQSMGNLRNGTYSTTLAFNNIQVAATDNVILSYQIINSSQGETSVSAYLQQASEKIANAAVTALATTGGTALGAAISGLLQILIPVPLVGSALSALAGWLVVAGWNIAFPDCDGPVASGVHILSGAFLQSQTTNGRKYAPPPENHPGVNSPSGCGSNSNYNVSWSVTQ
ncbi:fascin domain-containing protein [Rhodopila sp.]|uniref:fascin domain-containing protein n=1 Tax=Rhodopila sp. TaxID=2480087 RepID=UPI003D10669D